MIFGVEGLYLRFVASAVALLPFLEELRCWRSKNAVTPVKNQQQVSI